MLRSDNIFPKNNMDANASRFVRQTLSQLNVPNDVKHLFIGIVEENGTESLFEAIFPEHLRPHLAQEEAFFIALQTAYQSGCVSLEQMFEIDRLFYRHRVEKHNSSYNEYIVSQPFTPAEISLDLRDKLILLGPSKGGLANRLWQMMSIAATAHAHGASPAFMQDFLPELPFFPNLAAYCTLPPGYQPDTNDDVWRDERIQLAGKIRNGDYQGPPIQRHPIPYAPGLHVVGMLQSHVYLSGQTEFLQKTFAIDTTRLTLPSDPAVLDNIRNGRAVLMHLRGGDYLVNDQLPPKSGAYYENALQTLLATEGLPEDTPVYVVTDSPIYAGLICPKRWRIMEENPKMTDFYLLTQAKYLVIPNSTFSLMATVLNQNAARVVYPEVFFYPHTYADNTCYHFPLPQFSMQREHESATRQVFQPYLPLFHPLTPRQSFQNLSLDGTKVIAGTEIPEVAAQGSQPEIADHILTLRQIAKRGFPFAEPNPVSNPDAPYANFRQRWEAAETIFAALYPEEKVIELYDHIRRNTEACGHSWGEGQTIHLTAALKPRYDYHSLNATTITFPAMLAQKLQAVADATHENLSFVVNPNLSLVGTSSSRSTGSTIQRLTRQLMMVSAIEPGSLVVVLDDHSETGAALSSAYHAVRAAGSEVVGIASLTALREGMQLQCSAAVAEGFRALCAKRNINLNDLDEILYTIGTSVDTLTARETLICFCYFADPQEDRVLYNQVLAKYREDVGGTLFQTTLDEVFAEPPKTPSDLLLEIYAEAETVRIANAVHADVSHARNLPSLTPAGYLQQVCPAIGHLAQDHSQALLQVDEKQLRDFEPTIESLIKWKMQFNGR